MALAGDHWLILGDLGELGPDSQALHAEIGGRAREAGIEHLLTVGIESAAAAAAYGEGARHFTTHESLLDHLQTALGPDALVLVKGSRAARMETIVRGLCGQEGL